MSAFRWGVATSAYQIEGGVDLDGRVASIWDTFCAQPGAIADGSSGAVACDHRNRWRSDVDLMAALGVNAYRFSVAWPRVVGSGLDFYSALVDALLAADIEPYVTLYHWDLPQSLEDAGGWPARDTAYRFAEYAALVGARLGDRVRHWSTVNEPWCASMLGYASGVHAPGRVSPGAAVAAAHHLLLAHGLGYDALHAVAPDAEVAISLNPYPVVAAGSTPLDLDAARRVDGVANRLWYDPLLRGTYPDDVLADFAAVSDLRHVRDGDLAQIGGRLDALGVNYYRRHHVRFSPGASARGTWPGSPDVESVDPGVPVTAMGWAIEPDGLYEALTALARDYDPPPLYVHENGAAFDDSLDDADRIAFLRDHVAAARRAMADGVDLRAYFVWSLLDNFEWAEGYTRRFGLVHVDYATQRRTPRASARWYADLIAGSGAPPGAAAPTPTGE